MPQLGLGLRANVSGTSFYDGDAAAYFTRAGVTDATAKAQINAFVKGIKDLGLYSSMVCWPLRSAQNAGTGTTAYSLGGLGTFNGTFAGSPLPTWNADGVNFADSTTSKITTSLAQASSDDLNIFSVIECKPYISEPHGICGTRSGSTAGFTCAQDWYAQGAETLIWSSINALEVAIARITNGSFNAYTHRISVTPATKTAGIKLNTGTETTATRNQTYNAGVNFVIGSQTTDGNALQSLGGKMPFLAYFKTASLSSSIYTLYKTTIGTGLSLP